MMSQTFQLLTPIQDQQGSTITEVTVDEPCIKEIIKMTDDAKKHGPVMAMVLIISGQTGLDAFTVQKIKARDFSAISEYFNGFFTNSDKTTSSD